MHPIGRAEMDFDEESTSRHDRADNENDEHRWPVARIEIRVAKSACATTRGHREIAGEKLAFAATRTEAQKCCAEGARLGDLAGQAKVTALCPHT